MERSYEGATLRTHPGQLGTVLRGDGPWRLVFNVTLCWMSPIGMSPRHVAQPFTNVGVRLELEGRVFFMFGPANCDEAWFGAPDRFDVTRPGSNAPIAFVAGPHDCAGAAASKALIAEVALPVCWN